MDQALNSQKTPHTSPLRASYGMSFVSILMKNDRVIKGFYCNPLWSYDITTQHKAQEKRVHILWGCVLCVSFECHCDVTMTFVKANEI